MTTLNDLLKDLEIDVEEEEEEEEFDINSLDDKSKEYVKSLIDAKSGLETEVAKRDLVIKTMKETVKKPEDKKPKEEEQDDLGLEEDDPYRPLFGKLFNEIKNLSNKDVVDEEKQFETNLINFTKENPDVVKYANEMDLILEKHPSMKKDIPTLYELGKKAAERRVKLKTKKSKTEVNDGTTKVVNIAGEAKNIREAFDLAKKQQRR